MQGSQILRVPEFLHDHQLYVMDLFRGDNIGDSCRNIQVSLPVMHILGSPNPSFVQETRHFKGKSGNPFQPGYSNSRPPSGTEF